MSFLAPTEIKKLPDSKLQISWNDGSANLIPNELLRKSCPCAVCLEARGDDSHSKPINTTGQKRSSLLKIIEHEKSEQIAIKRIWPVGNYAIGVEWQDGHGSGIYSYKLLREIVVGSLQS